MAWRSSFRENMGLFYKRKYGLAHDCPATDGEPSARCGKRATALGQIITPAEIAVPTAKRSNRCLFKNNEHETKKVRCPMNSLRFYQPAIRTMVCRRQNKFVLLRCRSPSW